jgi:hypothetical protein
MTTADYILSKLNWAINDSLFATETCVMTDYINCLTGLLTKYAGKKIWFNMAFSDSSIPKHLVYWDTTDLNYLYEINIYIHGNNDSGCCIQNPVTSVTCTGTSGGVNYCISVTRSYHVGSSNDDLVPITVLDEAISSLHGSVSTVSSENWWLKDSCYKTTCVPHWALVGAGGLLAYLVLSKK